jgi:hemerythrin superfamily protein
MHQILSRLSSSATQMIRTDHTDVIATFHQYSVDTPPRVKKALADSVCLALEIHAQLEEEIFYPALRAIKDTEFVDKSIPEHNQMRQLISQVRNLQPSDPAFDDTFFQLMNAVMHHAADEETLLLPTAERVLAGQLTDLGAQMSRRRLQLAVPRTGQRIGAAARSMSSGSLVVGATALLACGYLLARQPRAQRPGMPHRVARLASR